MNSSTQDRWKKNRYGIRTCYIRLGNMWISCKINYITRYPAWMGPAEDMPGFYFDTIFIIYRRAAGEIWEEQAISGIPGGMRRRSRWSFTRCTLKRADFVQVLAFIVSGRHIYRSNEMCNGIVSLIYWSVNRKAKRVWRPCLHFVCLPFIQILTLNGRILP